MTFLPRMKPDHARAFQGAAKLYNVYILVRRTNLTSLDHVGDAMCVPKRLDCKAKTADRNFIHSKFGPKRTAGLVVDPTPGITGCGAFTSSAKYAAALQIWDEFAKKIHPSVKTLAGQRSLTYVPNGGFYFVDLDPNSERYGCVKFTISSVIAAGKYIHGDFDLYGIVPAAHPALNVAVKETRHGEKHSRSPEFFDVQHFVNKQIRAPMVLHGAHESYDPTHLDEGIDVFHPDGKITGAENVSEIGCLYDTLFKGRKLFTRNGSRDIVRGLFAAPR